MVTLVRGLVMELVQLVEAYQQLGLAGLLLFVLFLVVRYFLRENRKCWEKYEDQLISNKDEIQTLTNRMFDVLDKNSSSNIALTKSIESLENRLRT